MIAGKRAARAGAFLATALAVAGLALTPVPGAASTPPASAIGGVSFPGGATLQGVALDLSTNTAYVTAITGASGSVYAVDLTTGTIAATIPVGRIPRAIAVNPVTDTVYAANWRDATVSVISGTTDTVTATVPLPVQAGDLSDMAVNASTNTIYISGAGSGPGTMGIEVLNGATNSVSLIPLAGCAGPPVGVAVDPAANTVYTNCVYGADLSDHVIAIDGATGSVIRDVAETSQPAGELTFDPKTSLLYVGSQGPVTGLGVTAYNGTTLARAGVAALPGWALSLADNPDTGTVYAALSSESGGPSYLIDLVNGTSTAVTGAAPVSGPGWIAVEPDADTLVYASNDSPVSRLSVIPLTAPAITSRDTATFTTDVGGRFTVTGTGTPPPAFTEQGKLPYDLSLFSFGVLCCTPVRGTGGVYPITITAGNGVGPAATQRFTLVVDEPPAITSASHAAFTHGRRGSFTVRTQAFPVASVTERGALPPGLRFTANKNGTATISGIPANSARGKTYVIRLTARNGVGTVATQRVTLRVS